jgi:hypothetical protein
MFRARERAQMNGTPPEAKNEYSRAPRSSRGVLPHRGAANSGAREVHRERVGSVLAAGVFLAAVLLIGAEFSNLFSIHELGRSAPLKSVSTGSHHGYALIPIALLAAVMAVSARRGGGRPALLALAALAVIALVIALLVDLPDAHRTGIIAAGRGFEVGHATPGVGFYLETLGAVLLLIASGIGILAMIPGDRMPTSRRRRQPVV